MKTAQTTQLGTAAPVNALPGRSLELSYDGQGNRRELHLDGLLSHDYTANEVNEYTAVTYGAHAAAVSGVADFPGRVVAGDRAAVRQEGFFYRPYEAGSSGQWLREDVFATATPAGGGYAQAYTKAQKEVRVPPPSVAPAYDEAGNLLSDGQWTYVYDGNNRLIMQTSALPHPDDSRWRELRFVYDYLGRRVRKTVAALYHPGGDSQWETTTAFAYWEWHLLAEISFSTHSSSLRRTYTWGLDKEGVRPGAGGVGGLLQVVDHPTSKTYYALNDYLGNVIGLVDGANGSVAAAYEYDPFGRELRATGAYAAANPFRFSSQYTDSETGLVYFGSRYYHPEWGRFLNRDPIEEAGGNNLYRFVSNDPVNRWDLLGLADGTETDDQPESASPSLSESDSSDAEPKAEAQVFGNTGRNNDCAIACLQNIEAIFGRSVRSRDEIIEATGLPPENFGEGGAGMPPSQVTERFNTVLNPVGIGATPEQVNNLLEFESLVAKSNALALGVYLGPEFHIIAAEPLRPKAEGGDFMLRLYNRIGTGETMDISPSDAMSRNIPIHHHGASGQIWRFNEIDRN